MTPDILPMRADDPRIVAVRSGLRLLCSPTPCRAKVRDGVLVYHWHASEQKRWGDVRRALGRRLRHEGGRR